MSCKQQQQPSITSSSSTSSSSLSRNIPNVPKYGSNIHDFSFIEPQSTYPINSQQSIQLRTGQPIQLIATSKLNGDHNIGKQTFINSLAQTLNKNTSSTSPITNDQQSMTKRILLSINKTGNGTTELSDDHSEMKNSQNLLQFNTANTVQQIVVSNKNKQCIKLITLPTTAVIPNQFIQPQAAALLSSSSASASPSSSLSSTSSSLLHKKLATANVSARKSTNTVNRTKRSYSQTSHHESLQRIPVSSRSLSNHSAQQNYTHIIPITPRQLVPHHLNWHAPDSLIFNCYRLSDDESFDDSNEILIQRHWYEIGKFNSNQSMSRDEYIEMKRMYLRRQAYQQEQAQRLRSRVPTRRKLIGVWKTLQKIEFEQNKSQNTIPNIQTSVIGKRSCCIPSCSNNALTMTAYCYLHITLNEDQRLFHSCTAKFSDNSQCRVPVFDISHELPLCREHGWKRDNYDRMVQEQKPKKPPSRKKPKPITINRTPKRTKKKKPTATLINSIPISFTNAQFLAMTKTGGNSPHSTTVQGNHLINMLTHHISGDDIVITEPIQRQLSPILANHQQLSQQHIYTVKQQTEQMVKSLSRSQSQKINNSITEITNDIFTACENSSAYESSEDTGVGGLSESDGIEIPLGDARLLEEHDLELAEDAFNELFTVQQSAVYEPTPEEQEDLQRALEAVDEQVKSLVQMTSGSNNFLGNFLDGEDHILVDDDDICSDVVLNSPHQTARQDDIDNGDCGGATSNFSNPSFNHNLSNSTSSFSSSGSVHISSGLGVIVANPQPTIIDTHRGLIHI